MSDANDTATEARLGAGAPGVPGPGGADGGSGGEHSPATPAGSAPAGDGVAAGGANPAGSPPPLAAGVDPAVAQPVAAPADFPTDWREKLAGDNAQLLESLKRYNDPKALAAAFAEQRKALSQRPGVPQKPGPEATPEQVAEYRKAMDIPETTDGYIAALKLSDGRQIGETDKETVENFAKVAQDMGVPKGQFSGLVDWYFKQQEAVETARIQADEAFYADSLGKLKSQWGPEFVQNVNAIGLLFKDDGMKNNLLGARLADGRRLGDHPEVLSWLSGLAREVNPIAAIMPAATGSMESLQGRKAEIEVAMKKGDYYGNKALQEEYAKIINVLDRSRARGRAA